MKYFFILLFIIISSRGFSQETVINDANAAIRNVTPFSGIKVSGGIDVYLSQGDDYSLGVSAIEEKYRDNIKTEVNNGVLVISYDNDHFGRNYGDKKLRVYLSFKTLESIEGSGASDIIINGTLTSNSLLVKLSGAGDIKGAVKVSSLSLELSGASTVTMNGSAENVKIVASGASDIKNYDLHVENCIAKLSGASDVRLTISNSISASASGASTLFYQGNPDKKDVATSGASSISQRN
jgi:Putative auto-transporter adhesin, head GIN domain